ncbi:MAG TPA: helix-turn-helix transcriptional regulator [Candidatus Avipropionibacterium avicola]|uniref:Helix-turn-helix transcriptional regulator n=1 Tax=Candidatus Avipropionibacterium avicola TaxID=2840701 RepID=A0A9D1GZN8_9ACTN|nr:helix-turn-helix transcriptional regulator [Candidatus Avipropionibacterium avicola]
MTEHEPTVDERLAALEEAIAELSTRRVAEPSSDPGDDQFWIVNELERQDLEVVTFAGRLEVPDAGPVHWQYGQGAAELAERDWSELAATMDALAHPVRLRLVQLVHCGVRTTAELQQQEGLGTTGQLHHHLRQLVAAGWLTSPRRGHYEVPATRVVPLLTIMLAATH